MQGEGSESKQRSILERGLGAFSKVEPGEAKLALMMTFNIFLMMLTYYIIKVVREPLILTIEPNGNIPGGAELKSYGAAGQALVLMAFVPFYAWFSSRVERMPLIIGVGVFFLVCIELFSLGVAMDLPYIGFAFFIWVGIFSLSMIAQFWSYANDIYTKGQGERLFPLIGVGMVAGPPVGSIAAKWLFGQELGTSTIMHISAALLLVHLGVSVLIDKHLVRSKASGDSSVGEKLKSGGGFSLIFKSKYLLLLAALLLLLNIVNTTGEYILGERIVEASKAAANSGAFIGSFYGGFYFVVNLLALGIQALLVSRLVKYAGIAGVVLALPLVSLGAYALIGAGVGFAVLRWAKTAENATDYSVMNTAKAMLWLPTSREEKYKAKQAIDTFIVRLGDVVSAGVVALGINVFSLSSRGFAIGNIGFILVWLIVGVFLVKENRKLGGAPQ